MKFSLVSYLPIASVEIEYHGMKKIFDNLLLDTGSAATILDIDLCEEVWWVLLTELDKEMGKKLEKFNRRVLGTASLVSCLLLT